MGKIEDMQAFVRIVDAGSISRAANQLGVAKSSISRRLNELESRMNVQLLNRTTRKSSLTEAGTNFYMRAQQIISDVNELHAETASSKAELAGDLKITLPYSLGVMHLTSIINKFATLHRGLNFQLNFSDRQVDLVEEGLDVAIRIADLKTSSHIARKLCTINHILCASPEYLGRAGTPLTPRDLSSHDILGYTLTTSSSIKFTDSNGKRTNLRTTPKLNANNGEYLRSAAIAGLGIVYLPTFLVNEDICNGRLRGLLTNYSLPLLNAYAIYPQTRHLSRRVRMFIDFMAKNLSGTPQWDACLKHRI